MNKKNIFAVLLCLMIATGASAQEYLKWSVEIKYDSVQSLDGKYFAVKDNGKWGVVKDGKSILPCRYDYIDALGDDVITFVQDGKAGFADTEGNILIEASYPANVDIQTEDKTQLNLFDQGSCIVFDNGELRLIDKQNKRLLGDSLMIVSRVGNAVVIKQNGLFGMVNSQGVVTVEPQFLSLETLVAGKLYAYQVHTHEGVPMSGLLDENGKIMAKPQFEDFLTFTTPQGVFIKAYLPSGAQALFSQEGDMLAQPLYQVIEPTKYDAFFSITQDMKKGLLGKNYVLYVEPKYDRVDVVVRQDTFFVAYEGLTTYVLNTSNQVVAKTDGVVLDLIRNKEGNLLLITEQDLSYGLLSSEGKWLIEPQYDEVLGVVNDCLCVRKGKKWGAVDKNNNVVVDFVYGKARISNTAELIAFFDYKKGSKMLCKDGNIIDFPKSESVLVFGNYVEYKNKDKKVRIYSDNRRIPDNFITIGADREGILVAKTEKGWSYYNSAKCTPLTDKTFDAAGCFVAGKAYAAKDGSLLVLDSNFETMQKVAMPQGVNLHSIVSLLTLFGNQGRDNFTIKDTKTNKVGVITINKQ